MEKKEEDVGNLRDFYKGAYAALTAVLAELQQIDDCGEAYYLELEIVDMRDQVLNSLLDSEARVWESLLRRW